MPPDLIDRFTRSGSVRTYYIDGTRSYQLELNNSKPPFNDVKILKALSYMTIGLAKGNIGYLFDNIDFLAIQ